MRYGQWCRTWAYGASILAVACLAMGACVARADDLSAKPKDKDKEKEAAKSLAKIVLAETKQKLPPWDKVVDGATRLEGLFPLYYNEKEQNLFMEIKQDQYDKELILPIAIARGAGMQYLGGITLNFGDQWLISFRRAGDRLLVVRRNVRVRAEEGSPQADAVKTTYTDSVIKALPIKSEKNDGQVVLIDLADLFMTDLANIGIEPDRARSTWAKVKPFPKNVEIEVSAVFSMPRSFWFFFFGNDVPDTRGAQVVIHYGLSMLPTTSYQPRLADDRVGHFLTTVKDFSQDLNLTPKMRYATRWNLEKTKPAADKSPPKQPIIFWVERTVPREYRQYVRDGILEWNKAFEKIGFIDAIQVRDQQAGDDFDPEDIRYNTFRWIATSGGFAIGPSRTNPKTGEILDADIVFDEGMIRYLREEYIDMVGIPTGVAAVLSGQRQGFLKHHAADLPVFGELAPTLDRCFANNPEVMEQFRRPFRDASEHGSHADFGPLSCSQCNMGPGMQRQLAISAAVLAARGDLEPGGKVPEKLIAQAVKEIVMHEVGHTLGLRHNFKASSIYSLQQVNDPEFTAKRGNSGSVMDYLPANLARKGEKQGDYFTPTIGPYDYWAIEYAYKPIPDRNKEKEELAKIGSKVSDAELVYGTDEDVWMNPDPRISLFDLGDPLDYAKDRVKLVHVSLDDLQNRVVAKGEGWQRARRAFSILMGEMFTASYMATAYVTGEYTCRDHRDDKGNRPPMKPIEIAKQREALRLLQDEILSDKAFQFKPELLRHLAPEHWREGYWFSAYQVPVLQYVSSLQRFTVSQLLDSGALRSLQEVALHADPGQETLDMAEIFRMLTDAIWTELPNPDQKGTKTKPTISTIRRNLQREHVAKLIKLVLGPKQNMFSFYEMLFGDDFGRPAPPDARALARLHLTEIDARIKAGLAQEPDAMTKAHLAELHTRIGKTLDASIQVNEP